MPHRPGVFSVSDILAGDDLAPNSPHQIKFPVEVDQRWPVIRSGERPTINRTVRRLIYQRDRYRCQFCRTRGLCELDHIIPWSAGGPDASSNLRSACHTCNTTRSNYRTPRDVLAIPVTFACDSCIQWWVRLYGQSRYGTTFPGYPAVDAWCGNCAAWSTVTDPMRLK